MRVLARLWRVGSCIGKLLFRVSYGYVPVTLSSRRNPLIDQRSKLNGITPMPVSVGDKLGPYEILAPIGAGGMGEVYRARDPRLDRDVAVKVSDRSSANVLNVKPV